MLQELKSQVGWNLGEIVDHFCRDWHQFDILASTMGGRERILLADDRLVNREGIKITIQMFEEEYGHQVVGEAASVAQVEELLNAGLRPTLAIIDARMPNRGDGEKAAALIRQISPQTKIVSHSTDLQTWGDVNWEKGELLGRKLVEQISKL